MWKYPSRKDFYVTINERHPEEKNPDLMLNIALNLNKSNFQTTRSEIIDRLNLVTILQAHPTFPGQKTNYFDTYGLKNQQFHIQKISV